MEDAAYQNFPYGTGTSQTYDSRTDPYSYGLLWSTGAVGTHTVDVTTYGVSGFCSPPIPPTDGNSTRTVTFNTLACEPQFWNRHLAPDTIELYLPTPSMDGALTALTAAKNNWNSTLSGTGKPDLEIVRNPCDTGSPSCVTISAVTHGSACGLSNATFDAGSGEITGNAIIDIHANWTSMTASGLERTFTHELGHLLGLEDSEDTCGVSDAVMEDTFDCSQTVALVAPTLTDSIPANSSVHDGNTKAACGF